METENKSLSISLSTEIKCHSLTVKSNVQKVKILPKFETKKVRILINHQGRLINPHTNCHNPYLILLNDGLNYIKILVKELETNVDDQDFGMFNEAEEKHSIFITKMYTM